MFRKSLLAAVVCAALASPSLAGRVDQGTPLGARSLAVGLPLQGANVQLVGHCGRGGRAYYGGHGHGYGGGYRSYYRGGYGYGGYGYGGYGPAYYPGYYGSGFGMGFGPRGGVFIGF